MVSASCTTQPSPSSAVRTKRRIWRSSSIRIATGLGSPMHRLQFNRRWWWHAQGQRERKTGAAAGAIMGPNLSRMGRDDCAADREPETDAGRRRFTLTAREFLKNRLFPARRQAGTVVGDGHVERIADHLRRQDYAAPRGSVFGCV